ncbi:MAG: hypothetical protein HGB05_16420, partial [Chloroflexi bacterium]|nr:hypothetical protein [Chloroflexota bacterium]
MTIRKRTLLILGVTLIGLMIGLYVASSTLLLDSFARIEEREMAQNTQRVLDALRDRLNALNKTTRDYANWDDTYDFIQNGNAAYIESNLVNETFATNDLNLMLFVDNDGQLVYGKAIALQNQQEIPIPPALLEQLAPASPLVRHSSIDSEVTGILSLPEGPMLVVSRPILTSQYTGPVRGALIMGRYLDAAAEVMNYLLGRNALNFSFVSGYGTQSLAHPHHRFWGNQPADGFPPPPPGALAGGP